MSRAAVLFVCLLAGLSACTAAPDHRAARDGAGPPPSASVPERGRFEFVVAAHDDHRSVSLRSRGSFDRTRGRLEIAVDLTEVDATFGRATVVVVGDTVYVDCPYLARRLQVPTRWVRVRGSVGEVLGLPYLDPGTWPVDSAAVDRDVGPDGLVRTATMRFDASPEGGSAVVTVRYYDVDIPVIIEPPAPTEVTDVTDALGG